MLLPHIGPVGGLECASPAARALATPARLHHLPPGAGPACLWVASAFGSVCHALASFLPRILQVQQKLDVWTAKQPAWVEGVVAGIKGSGQVR